MQTAAMFASRAAHIEKVARLLAGNARLRLWVPARRAVLLSAALLATGCADLAGVREFASLSASITDSAAVSMRWRDTESRLKSLPREGDRPITITTGDRSKVHEETEKILRAVTAYMEVMGQLASDELPSVEPQVASLGSALNALPGTPIKQQQVQAFSTVVSLISKPLDAYRHLKVRELIRDAHDPLEKLLAGLAELGAIYQDDLARERKVVADWVNVQVAGGGRTASDFLARRYVADLERKYDEIDQGIKDYVKALQLISTKHERLINGLSTEETIKRTLAELKRTRKDLIEARESIRNALAQKL